jgi:hypothetical protein
MTCSRFMYLSWLGVYRGGRGGDEISRQNGQKTDEIAHFKASKHLKVIDQREKWWVESGVIRRDSI